MIDALRPAGRANASMQPQIAGARGCCADRAATERAGAPAPPVRARLRRARRRGASASRRRRDRARAPGENSAIASSSRPCWREREAEHVVQLRRLGDDHARDSALPATTRPFRLRQAARRARPRPATRGTPRSSSAKYVSSCARRRGRDCRPRSIAGTTPRRRARSTIEPGTTRAEVQQRSHAVLLQRPIVGHRRDVARRGGQRSRAIRRSVPTIS